MYPGLECDGERNCKDGSDEVTVYAVKAFFVFNFERYNFAKPNFFEILAKVFIHNVSLKTVQTAYYSKRILEALSKVKNQLVTLRNNFNQKNIRIKTHVNPLIGQTKEKICL